MRLQGSYRREIDGLRAVAVLAVIAYHLDADWLPGGFLGVDVFFVISGYLITSILLKDLSAGSFSILKFYERRARRILPALFVVTIATTIAAYYLADSVQLVDFGASVVAQLLFVANFFFWLKDGYFSAPSETKFLLHTWSLSVEEQFYLFLPLALLALHRFSVRTTLIVLSAVGIVSLLAAQTIQFYNASTGFYLWPFRAWELLAGSLVLFFEKGRIVGKPGLVGQALAALGLTLILGMFWLFASTNPHPSFQTVPVIVGSCLILGYGRQGIVFQLLSLPVMCGIGVISYSLYLWHWPVLASLRLANLGQIPENTWLWYLPLCLVLAWLTWWLVEQPMRRQVPLRFFIPASAVSALSLIAAAWFFIAMSGLPGRLYPAELDATFAREDTIGTCMDNPGADHRAEGWFCELGRPDGPIDFIVLGDSHAHAALPAFRALAAQRQVRAIAITDSGCIPFLGLKSARLDQDETNCFGLNQRMASFAATSGAKRIYLVARWSYYSNYSAEEFAAALQRTVDTYVASGTEVAVLGQVPLQNSEPRELYKQIFLPFQDHQKQIELLSKPRSEFESERLTYDLLLKGSKATYLDPIDLLCGPSVCPVGTSSASYYLDADHLSITGSLRLLPLLEEPQPVAADLDTTSQAVLRNPSI